MNYLIIAVPLALFSSAAFSDESGDVRFDASSFVTNLESGQAFKSAGPDVRESLLSIARLASAYQGLDGKDLLSVPSIQLKEEHSEFWRDYNVIDKAAGTETAIAYNPHTDQVTRVRVDRADRSTVSVSFDLAVPPGITEGMVTFPGGQRHMNIRFKKNQPILALPAVGTMGRAGIRGKILAWDENGNVVTEYDVSTPREEFQVLREMFASLSLEQLDALGVSASERLNASRAFQNADRELKRQMENLVSWSAKVLAVPHDALMGSLMGDEIEHAIVGEEIIYTIKEGGEPLWTVMYDQVSRHPKQAVYDDGGLALNFDFHDNERLVGGWATVREIGKEDTYWLVSFFPGRFTPRMAISAVGSPPRDLLAIGSLYVWSTSGDVVLERTIDSPTSVEVVLSGVEDALSDDQRTNLEWKGKLAERQRLLGMN